MTAEYIDIPLDSGNGGVRFFPDELPADHIDLIDVLRSEIPPLKTWRLCAIEYFKQGEENAFNDILADVVTSLEQGSVEKYDRSQPENAEAIADINIARAAKELWTMIKIKNQPASNQNNEAYETSLRRFIELERSVSKMNEFIWLVKGFVQIIQGEFKGAEDNFRQVFETATKVQNANKKKYLFGSLIGQGILEYHNKRYSVALEKFSKALISKPEFDVSLKFVIALCFYRLGQLDKAKAAIERSLQQGVGVNQLLLLALIELDRSKYSDQEKKAQCQQKFHDYLNMAYNLDKANAVVLNLLANHIFNSWKTIQRLHSTQLSEPAKIITGDQRLISIIEIGSLIRIERKEYTIIGVSELGNSVGLVLSQPIQNVELPIEISDVDIKDYKSAKEFAVSAIRSGTIPLVRAEGYYILGKIAQAQKKLKNAYEFYKKATEESNEMNLAFFGAAQVLFEMGDHATALDLFEKLKESSNNPEDRDTQAYIGLLRGILKEETIPFDLLKEVAPNFTFEYELWLSQGQLRLKKLAEHGDALKCLLAAEIVLKHKSCNIPYELLLNISILYQYQGKYNESKQYACSAISTRGQSNMDLPREFLLYSEFENFFYHWSGPVGTVVQSPHDYHNFRFHIPITKQHLVQVGMHFRTGGVVWAIRSVINKEDVIADTLFGGSLQMPSDPLELELKLPKNNFCDSTLLCSYNYARSLEEEHKIQAASAIYKQITKMHPSFVDAYVRLSSISRRLNKLQDSKNWLLKAKLCKEDHTEFDVIMSDLFMASEEPEKARELLASSYLKNRTDAQILVANGNFYLDIFNRKKSDDSQLKLSYKYFHPALQEHVRNLYAAHGLGIVCALKGELDAGQSILEKVRHAATGKKIPSSLNMNTAYIIFLQQRFVDADRHLQTIYKDVLINGDPIEIGRCLNLMHVVQYQLHQHEECVRSALKSLHLNPLNFSVWFNYGVAALVATKYETQGSVLTRLDKIFKYLNSTSSFKHSDTTDLQQAQKLLKSKKRKFDHERDHTEREKHH